MSAIFQSALIGGVIVRNASKRLAPLLPDVRLDNPAERRILDIAINLAACGLGDSNEYAADIARALRFERRSTKPLVDVLYAFEAVAEANPAWTLEDLCQRLTGSYVTAGPVALPANDDGDDNWRQWQHWTEEAYDK